MTGLEIILLCILMVTSTASVVIIWRQHLAFKGYKQGSEIVLRQLTKQLYFLQMSTNDYQNEHDSGSQSIH